MNEIKTIAHIQSAFPTKFGIPRQSGVVKGLEATIVFEPEYRNPDALRGLEEFSHIWLIWGFSRAERETWSPTVRPPRLGGNTRMGVFATRSPYRPNALGLSSVELCKIEQHPQLGPLLHVAGADLMDGTPIYDIKPYIPYADSHPDATGGFASDSPAKPLQVTTGEGVTIPMPENEWNVLKEVLEHDPRPRYHSDPARVYGMEYAGYEVRFRVDDDVLTVVEIRLQAGG